MSNYINRELAISSIELVSDGDTIPVADAQQAVKEVPSAEVERVVKCKDCYAFRRKGDEHGFCNEWANTVQANHFCSLGAYRIIGGNHE